MKKQNILLVPLIGILIGVAVTMIAKKATASSINFNSYVNDAYGSLRYSKGGYKSRGYSKGGYESRGYSKGGYESRGYSKGGYESRGYSKGGYKSRGYSKGGYKSGSKGRKNFGGYDSDTNNTYEVSRYSRGRNRGRGNLSCLVEDRGWEEHYGGHRSCRACLKRHGRCIETCSKSYYVCEAILKVDKKNRNSDRYRGRDGDVFSGRGPDAWAARRRAERKCERDNFGTGRSCDVDIDDCDEISEVISRNRCG